MDTAERRATAALWSLRGIGPKTLERLEARVGSLGALLELPASAWRTATAFTAQAQHSIASITGLAEVADALEARLAALGQRALFPGDHDWPERLVADEAPVLFAVGPGAALPRRRVAVVGTRHPEPGASERVRRLARELVGAGLVIVSGGAEGIDQAAHFGALDGGGETWAFLGCAIEQMDEAQLVLCEPFQAHGGTFFSQFPPGVRSDRSSFRRRNPLISGSSDAVLIARAPLRSGALITAEAAERQGRPLLAIPADPWNLAAQGSNELLRCQRARACLTAADLIAAVGLQGVTAPLEPPPATREAISDDAALVLDALGPHAADVDELAARCPLASGQLSACLVELQLAGYVVPKAGGRFEKR